MASPNENKQLLAALFGTMEREVRDQRVLGPTPWVWQLAHDLEVYGDIIQQWGTTTGQLTKQVKDMGGTVLLRDEWRDRYRVMNHEAVQTHQITEPKETAPDRNDSEEVCGAIGANGDVCQFTGTKRAVAVHRATTHGQRNPVRELIHINECPLCRKQFTGVRTTGAHVLRSMQAKMCHTKIVRRSRPYGKYFTE